MKKLILLVLFAWSNAYAGYNANFSGKITAVLTYPGSTQVLIRVEGQPTSHPQCTSLDFLAIPSDISNESRQLVMSRLLLAFASGQAVNIGYDKEGGCVSGRIRVHRVG